MLLYESTDKFKFTALGTFLHVFVLMLHYAFIRYCDEFKCYHKYRLHEPLNFSKDSKLLNRCMVEQALKLCLVQPLLSYFILYPLMELRGMFLYAPLPSFTVVIQHMLISAFCLDTLFYWVHRSLHSKYLYSWVHKQHHEFKVNNVLNTEYAHVIEDIFSSLLPTFAGSFLMQSHPFVVILWVTLRVLEAQDAHSNYCFPISEWIFMRSPAFHAYHHSHNIGNYGLTSMWDTILSTNKHYREYLRKKAL